MSQSEKSSSENLTFEQAYARLEEIVRKLETGEASLDESLKLFEEGVALTRQCAGFLDKAEAKINLLVAAENGEPEVQAFEPRATGAVS